MCISLQTYKKAYIKAIFFLFNSSCSLPQIKIKYEIQSQGLIQDTIHSLMSGVNCNPLNKIVIHYICTQNSLTMPLDCTDLVFVLSVHIVMKGLYIICNQCLILLSTGPTIVFNGSSIIFH